MAYRQNPTEKNIGLLLARQLIRLDSLPSALRTYEDVIHLDSPDDRAYVGASLVMAQQGENEEALDFLIRRENPNGFAPWKVISTKGTLYYYLEDIATALNYLKRSSYHERDACIDYYVALCYHVQGERFTEKAKYHMHRAIELGAVVSPEIEDKFGVDLSRSGQK